MISKTLLTIFLSLLFTQGFAKHASRFPETTQVMQLSEVDDNFIEAFSKGKYPNLILEVQEGSLIPVSFVSNMGMFSIENFPELKIRVHKTCWVRFLGKKGYISIDQKYWEKPEELFCGDFKTKIRFHPKTQSVTVESDREEDHWDFDW